MGFSTRGQHEFDPWTWKSWIGLFIALVVVAVIIKGYTMMGNDIDDTTKRNVISHEKDWCVDHCNWWGCDHYFSKTKPEYDAKSSCLTYDNGTLCKGNGERFEIAKCPQWKDVGW